MKCSKMVKVAWAIKKPTGQFVTSRGVIDLHNTKRSAEQLAVRGEVVVRVKIVVSCP